MDTETEFPITTSTPAVYQVPKLTGDSARKVASLLFHNHHNFNIFWNHKTYHNHQVHYLLTAFALGANPDQLQVAFDVKAGCQRPRWPVDEILISKLSDERYFRSMISQDTYDNWFNDFTAFFQRSSEKEPWPDVVNRYLFSRSAIAEQLLVGIFAGVIHPLIHFGFGIEFGLAPVIAESLAMATCHNKYFGPFFHRAEELGAVMENPGLYDLDYWDGGDSLNDAILADASEKLCEIASRWTVKPDQLAEMTAEMTNVSAFITGATQRPGRMVKLDFFFIHCVNASIFFSAFNEQNHWSIETKCRLLEWKGRSDLLTYASRVAPKLYAHEIADYKPLQPDMTWSSLIKRTNELSHDDGHIAKLVRALAYGAKVCETYETDQRTAERFPLKGTGWLQIANMGLDTTTDLRVPARWMRGAGAERNWVNVGPRDAKK